MIKLIAKFLGLISKRRKSYGIKFDKFPLLISKDTIDERDRVLKVESDEIFMPEFIDYSEFVPPIKYQGLIGSCGSHAAITGIETLLRMKKQKWNYPLSEMYHYWLVRREEYMNTFPADSGQTGREAMKVIKAIGAVPETVYPYQPVYFNDGPSMSLFAKSVAKYWKISLYERCYSVDSIKKALIKEAVVWLGVPVNKSIFKYKTGILNFNKKDGSAGGHAMLIIGYDDNKKAFKVANSWGLSWGKKGYGWIGYDYFYNCDWFDAWSFDL